jgi:hypothetical protein
MANPDQTLYVTIGRTPGASGYRAHRRRRAATSLPRHFDDLIMHSCLAAMAVAHERSVNDLTLPACGVLP